MQTNVKTAPTGGQIPFRHFGTMIDCSRNAVMKPAAVERWIDLTASLGYDSVLLYTEDTYEVPEEPYFGYLRGRYTQDELRRIDRYAAERGVEVIPCIQTLAHLNAIVGWPAYAPHVDTGDILLAGDERVYTLIDRCFSSLAQSLTTRTVNIGMDEAHMLGRGRYYDLHGEQDRFAILLTHLRRVAEIGARYGFTLMMWSDMFFRLANGGEYYSTDMAHADEIRQQIPKNVRLIYWDYYSLDKGRYDSMITAHKKLDEGTWFAGGLWTWTGLAPHNGYSISATRAALQSCREHGIEDVFLTMWGDDGGECSKFTLLPSLFSAACAAGGCCDDDAVARAFAERFGLTFTQAMLFDLPGTPGGDPSDHLNPDKYLLYGDPFSGKFDSTLTPGCGESYAACAEKLSALEDTPGYGYLFATLARLCEVLAIKAELGVRTRAAYSARDRGAIAALIGDYAVCAERTARLHDAVRDQWYAENKGQGFEVQDVRLGGLRQRLDTCRDRLEHYLAGDIDTIEELDETLLDFCGGGETFGRQPLCMNGWTRMTTAGAIW